jgi:methionyl-tRNA formyltransferase
MAIDKNVDAGPILAQEEVVISALETAETLTNRLFILGASLLVKVLPSWVAGRLEVTDQNASMATYTKKFEKEDGKIQWGNPAHEICARLRAFSPWPGVYTYWQGRILKIIEAYVVDFESQERTGAVITLDRDTKTIGVCTGRGVLVLSKVRLEGRRDTDIWSFAQGHPSFVGSILNGETLG